MKELEFLKKLQRTKKYDKKSLPKVLKFLEKIKTVEEYEKYKGQILVGLIDWSIEIIIRAILFFAVFMCLSASGVFLITPLKVILLAIGISLSWYLLSELKQDLWRKNG